MNYQEMKGALVVLAGAIPYGTERANVMRMRGEHIDCRLANVDRETVMNGKRMLRDMERAGRALGVPIEYVRLMKYREAVGVYTEDGVIKIRRTYDRDAPHAAHTLVHELTHALLHNDPFAKMPRRDEAEAECVAYLVSSAYKCVAMDSALYLATYEVTAHTVEQITNRAIADARLILDLAKGE